MPKRKKTRRPGRPELPKGKKRVSRTVTMRPKFWKYADCVARQHGCSRNQAFEIILERDMVQGKEDAE